MNPFLIHRTRRGARRAGFTILEIMVVLLIVGLILGFVGQNVWQALFSGQEKATRNQIKLIESAMGRYRLDHQKYPDSLEDLTSGEGAPGGEPYMDRIPLDPWGNEYHYELTPEGRPLILSYGEDGEPGGEGKAADISNQDEV